MGKRQGGDSLWMAQGNALAALPMRIRAAIVLPIGRLAVHKR
jgi:hypothetical protein